MSDSLTCAGLIEKTRLWLTGSRGIPLNRLDADVDATQTEVTVAYDPGPIAQQTYIAIDDEVLYVWEVDRGSKSLTVSRGQLGTEGATHTNLTEIETSARFTKAAIKGALQDEIRSWPDDVFQVKTRPIDLLVNEAAFDLGVRDSDFYFVFSIERAPVLNRTTYVADRWSSVPFRTARQMPRDSFPSGTAIFLTTRVAEAKGLRVMYAAPFDVDDITDDDDCIDDWGLSRSMLDIPPIGAAARLIQASEIIRTDTEALATSRIASEIPPSYQSQTAVALRTVADRRIRAEAMKLRGRYPMPS